MAETIPIGPLELLDDAPTVVTHADHRYILSLDEGGEPVLFDAVCPHQRGRVGVVDESTLRCPNHRWEFDAASGDPIRGDEPLEAYDVTVTDGELRATVDR